MGNAIPSSRYEGSLSGLSANIVYGWVRDVAAPTRKIVVEILVDDTTVATCLANQGHSTDHLDTGELHGFSYTIPNAYLNVARRISAKVANHDVLLAGTIELVRQQPSKLPPPSSQLWYAGGLLLTGWAWDPQAPGTQLSLRVTEGQRVIAQGKADRPHPALAWMQSTEHGFQIELPWTLADGCNHDIHVETAQGIPLTGSPVTVCANPEGLSRLLSRHWTTNKPASAASTATLSNLVALARVHERISPASVGFGHYPQWFELKGRTLEKPHDPPAPAARIAVLIAGPGNEAGFAVTEASVADQRLRATHVRRIGQDIRACLRDALDDGVTVVIPLESGDRLASAYTEQMLAPFADPDVCWAYSDCDQDGPAGERSNPWFKPAWDPDLFLGTDLVTPGSMWRASFLRAVMDDSPDTPLSDWQSVSVLAAAHLRKTDGVLVHRHPAVLYHRAYGRHATPYASEARSPASKALLKRTVETLDRHAVLSDVPAFPGLTRVKWSLPAPVPCVSLIVPTRDQVGLLRTCIDGLLDNTSYPGVVEILVVDNGSIEAETHDYFRCIQKQGVRVLPYPGPFNYSAINNHAVDQATGSIIGLVNNDIEIMDPAWLTEMVSQLARPGVGAVGAKLRWPNGMVQHAGVVVGIQGLAAHTGNSWHADDPGYLGLNQLTRQQSAVTAACLLLHRSEYLALEGLDEIGLPVTFNDVDLCLRLRARKLSVLWTAATCLVHAESASRGKDDIPEKRARAQREQRIFRQRWQLSIGNDPFYHPSLTHSWEAGPYNGLSL